ncbi:EEIG1/EHBP1 protein amino-terminal domain containing protein [Ceratobasidium theobromae]|uniref:EEIG1/EHBP1 protein amino-terminal domain containing protein n=1 Tax=Ceratobasidium theobromae TaxID=1582974 RepID=A0A5N5QFQ4_9AGAM|nr:EEIG1/EHBP1 protein amino-terminal domain containing protein [Ceratobasidium theobromae]
MAHPPHFGLRAQLRNYFAKHATFSVQISIHELANVPLVSGDFACRWRLKGAQSLSQALGRRDSASAKSIRSDGTGSISGSGSFKEKKPKNSPLDADIEVQVQPPSPPLDPASAQASISTTLSLGESEWSSGSDGKPPILLEPSASPDHGSDTEDGHTKPTSAAPTNDRSQHTTQAGRGQTATVPIADHTVRWEELVELAAHMGVAKESKSLMPADLKLTVEQVPLSQEPAKPKTPLGVVRINLAEYVGKGPVTRRYLLRESKTNATLKLTIQVKWLSGEQEYIAPPLQKAQIMEGVAGLMSHDRILPPTGMRTPTRPPISAASSSSSFVNLGTPDLLASPSFNRGRGSSLSRAPTLSHSLSFTRPTTPGPTARTEQIIEALFNPVPTTNPNPSPFAYYAPSRPPVRKGTANVLAAGPELDTTWSIAKAQQDAQARATLTVPTADEPGPANENAGWWKRLANGTATLSKGSRRLDSIPRPSTAV